jgi:hypothetical protein
VDGLEQRGAAQAGEASAARPIMRTVCCRSMRTGVELLVFRTARSSPIQPPHAQLPAAELRGHDPPRCLPWCGCTLGPGVVRTGSTARAAGGGVGGGGGNSNEGTPHDRCWLALMGTGVELLYRLSIRPVSPFGYIAAACAAPRC